MAKKEKTRSIEQLPGWVWVYKEENEVWSYTDKKGVAHYTTERHAKNLLTGEVLSVGTAQRLQRKVRSEGVAPVPPSRLIGEAYPQESMREGHGRTLTFFADNLDILRHYIMFERILNNYPYLNAGYIGVYYKEKVEDYPEDLGDPNEKRGYSILTPYYNIAQLEESSSPWITAEERLDLYILDDISRVYFYGIES